MTRPHVVLPGECLASLAHAYGFGEGRTIWAHPDNAELRKKRPDPGSLVPGDVAAIPDKEAKNEICSSGRRHAFRVRRARAWLRLFLRDDDGSPLADRKYWLVVGNSGFEGRTDERGLLQQKVPPDAQDADLVVWMDEEDSEAEVLAVSLWLGHLHPVETVPGAQARLTSLGYPCGNPEGEADAATREAVRAFQKDQGLPDTGALDAPTLERLRKVYQGS